MLYLALATKEEPIDTKDIMLYSHRVKKFQNYFLLNRTSNEFITVKVSQMEKNIDQFVKIDKNLWRQMCFAHIAYATINDEYSHSHSHTIHHTLCWNSAACVS